MDTPSPAEDEANGSQLHNSDESELDFIEDEDDLVSDLDRDGPTGLIEYPSGSSDTEDEQESVALGEWQGFRSEQKAPKRRRETKASDGKKKRRKLGTLPTFASYEDYAAMIEGSREEDI